MPASIKSAMVDRTRTTATALYGLRETPVALGNKAADSYADTLFRQAWLGDAEAPRLEAP